MRKILLLTVALLFAFVVSANALTVAWDAYTDTGATALRLYQSTDQSTWVESVFAIPTDKVSTEIPDGADNTRVYYIMRAVDTVPNPEVESGNSNMISFYWTSGGGGYTGPSEVDQIKLLDCSTLDTIDDNDSVDWDLCNERHNKPL